MQTVTDLPEATKKRLVQLLRILKEWQDKRITSAEISEKTCWKDSLIRHDLFLVKKMCGLKVQGVSNGYDANDLRDSIEKLLGLESKNLCIVGLGRLGAALLDENLFEESNFSIKAGFDSNLYRVEILRSIFPLYPADDMERVIKHEKIEYAILAVADKSAQSMADKLVDSGIKGIVNMTNVVIKVSNGVKVENLSIINALNLIK